MSREFRCAAGGWGGHSTEWGSGQGSLTDELRSVWGDEKVSQADSWGGSAEEEGTAGVQALSWEKCEEQQGGWSGWSEVNKQSARKGDHSGLSETMAGLKFFLN